MTQSSQQILNQISQIARQLEQQELLNAQKLEQGQEISSQQQQQMASGEQNAAQKLEQMQQLIQQFQQLNQTSQGFQSFTGANSSQTPFQEGFAGTNAEEVKRQNQQAAQNQNSRDTF